MKERRAARLKRGLELRRRLAAYEEDGVPAFGESLKDFFDRSALAWDRGVGRADSVLDALVGLPR